MKKKKPKKKPLRVVADPVIDATAVTPELSPETHAAFDRWAEEAKALNKEVYFPLGEPEREADPAVVGVVDPVVIGAVADPSVTPELSPETRAALVAAMIEGAQGPLAWQRDRVEVYAEHQAQVAQLAELAVQPTPPSNGNGHAPYLDEPSDLAALLPKMPSRR